MIAQPQRVRARWRENWPLWALLALAAIVRFTTLTQQSLWYDEAVTALRVLHPSLSATLSGVVHIENTPPLYYLLEWIWTRALGTGVFALRSLSASAGVATVLVGWAIGRQLGTRATAVALAAITAINPLFVWYSQEARAYELFVLLAAVAFLFFLRARERPTGTNLAIWAVASALSLATHYFAAFLIAPEALLLLQAPSRDRRLLVALAVVATATTAAALAPLALAQGGRGTSWIANWPLSGRAQAVGYYYLLGESGHALGRLVEWATLLPILATIALAFKLNRQALRRAILCAVVGAAAILAPLVLALLGLDYLAPRYLIAAWVPLSAALAVLLTARGVTTVGVTLTVLICLAGAAVDAAVVKRPQLQRGNWSWVAGQLRRGFPDRAVVILTLGGLPLQYYTPSLRGASVTELRVREIDLVGYAPLRHGATRPPARHFAFAGRSANHGLVVLRFRAPAPLGVSVRRLLAARPVQTPTEVLAAASAARAHGRNVTAWSPNR
jgi:uncharacterized membrane protein